MSEGVVAEMHHTRRIPQWKVDEVAEIKRLAREYGVFGLVGIRGISSRQIQKIREETRLDLLRDDREGPHCGHTYRGGVEPYRGSKEIGYFLANPAS